MSAAACLAGPAPALSGQRAKPAGPTAASGARIEPSASLPRLVVVGQSFALETGARWTAIEATDFNLFARFLSGEDVRPILRQRVGVGFNLLRVWTAFDVCPTGSDGRGGTCQPIGRLVPKEHRDFDARLGSFLQLAADHGLYVELVAFTGRFGTTLPTDDERVAHWERLISIAGRATNAILELVNEHDHAANAGLPYDRLRQPPAPTLASHGSGQAGSAPKLPIWTHATYHPGFGSDWTLKAIHDGMAQVAGVHRVPVLVNETTRFPDNDRSVAHAYDVGRGCAVLQAGCAFHSVTGKNSRLWDGLELDLAKAWAAGARSIPLDCQRGVFKRIGDPAFLAVFERTDAGPGCRVEVRR